MSTDELWPKVRSEPLTREELRLLAERAQDCSSDLVIKRDCSTWELRAGLWLALAQAAFACEAMLARDELHEMWGAPGAG